MPYDLMYMWNLKHKITTKNSKIEKIDDHQWRRGWGVLLKTVKEIKKHKWPVIKTVTGI